MRVPLRSVLGFEVAWGVDSVNLLDFHLTAWTACVFTHAPDDKDDTHEGNTCTTHTHVVRHAVLYTRLVSLFFSSDGVFLLFVSLVFFLLQSPHSPPLTPAHLA